MRRMRDADRHIPDAIADLLEGAGGLSRVRRLQATSLGFDRELWARLASLGWIGAAVPESQGGTGLTHRDIVLLLEQAGRRLMPEPLAPAIAASIILARSGAGGAALLAELIAGRTVCVPVENSGETADLFDGHMADFFLTTVERDGRDAACVIPRSTPGLALACEETVDGGSITRLRFDGVNPADFAILLYGADAVAAARDARDTARLGTAALLTGLMDEALDMTVAYMKERRQFGTAIGSFQALQHRAASLHIEISSSRALLYEAAKAAGTPRQSLGAAAAKAHTAETALHVTRECVQMHGAMGYTHEHDISLFFRRAMALVPAYGDPVACRKLLHAERAALQ
jgi:alkylation response protein AidB-like acyl-CoA dehydrogenase